MLVVLEVPLGERLLVAKLLALAILQPWTSKLAAGSGKESDCGWQGEAGTAAGSDPFGQQAPTTPLPVLRQQDEGLALPLCQLCSLPLLAAGIAWLCSLLWGESAQCCPQCPGPALLHQLQCHRAELPANGRMLPPPQLSQAWGRKHVWEVQGLR